MKYHINKFTDKITWGDTEFIFQIYIHNENNKLAAVLNVTCDPYIAVHSVYKDKDKNVLSYLLDENLFTILKKINDYDYVLKSTKKLLLEVI